VANISVDWFLSECNGIGAISLGVVQAILCLVSWLDGEVGVESIHWVDWELGGSTSLSLLLGLQWSGKCVSLLLRIPHAIGEDYWL